MKLLDEFEYKMYFTHINVSQIALLLTFIQY